MPAAAQQNDSYAENRDQLERARIQPVATPNKEASNDPEYEKAQPSSAKVIPFPARSSNQQTNTPVEQVSFFSFAPAFLTALLKDLLDFTFVTSILGIGTLLTGCFCILIALFILFFPKQRYHTITNVSLAVKELSFILGITLFEGLAFPINLLPATTGVVYAIYRLEKAEIERQSSSKKKGLAARAINFAAQRIRNRKA